MSTNPVERKLVDVAVGMMIRPDGSLLLGQRPEGKPYSGWWELPGGKLEPGETVLEALTRELQEELGVQVLEATPWVTHVHAYEHATVRLYFCRVTRWKGEPRGLESQALQWVRMRAARAGEADVAGLVLEPAVGPLLPATLPPLRWLQVPDTYAITRIGAPAALPGFLLKLDVALARGLRLIQFREPAWPDGPAADTLHAALREVLAHAEAAGARVVVNSTHPQAWWSEADGVHLRAADLAGERPALPASALLGASAHDAAELAHAKRLQADFAVLGPVLPTGSHPGQAGLGWPAFQELAVDAGLPVFALGGLAHALRGEAVAHGAHGFAGISAFW